MVIAFCALTANAQAGTYDVLACDVAPEGVNRSWTGSASAIMQTGGENCPSAGRDAGGLFAGNAVNAGTAAPFATAMYSFDAPAGTSIVYLSARYWFHRRDPHWRVGVFADNVMLHGCEPATTEPGCDWHSRSIGVPSEWGWSEGVQRVAILTACGNPTGCRTDTASPTGDRGGVRLYSAMVRVQDASAPAVWDVGDGGLTNGGWQRGSQYVGFASSDNVGIRRTRLYVDGRQLRDDGRDCDFTRRTPCYDVTYERYTVDTAALADGNHDLRVESVDTAGNSSSLTKTFRSDNTAPDMPSNVVVEGGSDWRQTNLFRVNWRNPASASPITVAHYRLCNEDTGVCTAGSRAGGNISSISDLSVPEPGHYALRLFLQDETVNVNSANQSETVHLRFDNVAPGEAAPVNPNRWLNADEAPGFDQVIQMKPSEVRPASGIAGYSVTIDGSDPDVTIDSVGDKYRIAELSEGMTIVKARAISGAGVPSGKVGSTILAVDRSAPVAGLAGAPAADTWVREPVILHVSGIDQPGLSGMAGAPDGAPIDEGGYVSYRIDGASPTRVRGNGVDVVIREDGEHVVSYQAVDVAGNESAEQTARFKIDRTPPELVVFEEQNRADPRRVVVAAADRTSGVAGGRIEVRQVGGDDWRQLETTHDGNRLSALIADESIPEGVYELRARVTDAAGNEATGDRRRDGTPARLDVPLPGTGGSGTDGGTGANGGSGTNGTNAGGPDTARPDGVAQLRDTSLVVVFEAQAVSKKKCKRRNGRKKCSRPPAAPPTRTRSAKLPYGKAVVVRGSLTAGVVGVADSVVDVYSKAKAAGAEFVPAGALRTDANGDFSYKAPPGTGRTLSFRYAGSPTHRGATDELTLQVSASTTLKVSRRAVRNGQSVTFSGQLQSKPLAGRTKALNLQAYYRRRWRTFATPAVNKKGRWSYRYRFEATRGRVNYRFRAVIPAGSDYPYEQGTSRAVGVAVSGR